MRQNKPWRGFIGGERTGEMELAELIGLAISLYRCSESRVSDDDDLLMLPELDLDRLLSVELDRILSLYNNFVNYINQKIHCPRFSVRILGFNH